MSILSVPLKMKGHVSKGRAQRSTGRTQDREALCGWGEGAVFMPCWLLAADKMGSMKPPVVRLAPLAVFGE